MTVADLDCDPSETVTVRAYVPGVTPMLAGVKRGTEEVPNVEAPATLILLIPSFPAATGVPFLLSSRKGLSPVGDGEPMDPLPVTAGDDGLVPSPAIL